jgi:hypothetical protein
MRSVLRRTPALVTAALLAAPLATPFAASQLHKCIDGGRTVYQQQACAVTSAPETAASAPRLPASASTARTEVTSTTRSVRSASPASSALARPR